MTLQYYLERCFYRLHYACPLTLHLIYIYGSFLLFPIN